MSSSINSGHIHKRNKHMKAVSTLLGVAVAATASATAAATLSTCSSALFSTASPPAWAPLGAASPVSLRSIVQGESICVQVSLQNQPTATWFALAIAKSSRMINSPPTNAVLFTTHNATAALYVLEDAAPLGVHYQPDQTSSLRVVDSVVANGGITLTYERPLAAASSFDVPITLDVPTTVNWAVGFSTFPDYHDLQGSAHVTFTDGPKPPTVCSPSLLKEVPAVRLNDGPLSIQSVFVGATTACIQVTLTDAPEAAWFGLSFAPTTNMINSPANNALVYHIPNSTAVTYDLVAAAPESIVPSANQTASYHLVYASSVGGKVTYVVERTLAAATATDVAILIDKPTIVNWAVGSTSFPDYHESQGSARLQFSKYGVAAASIKPLVAPLVTSSSVCDEAAVASTPAVHLGDGPLSIQSIVVGGSACIRVTSTDTTLAWFAISVAPTTNMINTPTNNAIVFQFKDASALVYDLHDAAPDSVLPHPNASASIRVLHVSSSSTQISYFFERTLAAATSTDVAISTTESSPTIVNWAIGTSAFPDYHDVQGSTKLVFTSTHVWDLDHPVADPPCNHVTFASISSVTLSEESRLSLKYVVQGPNVCIQVVLVNPLATWFAISVAPTTNMINTPTNNALVYLVHNASAHTFDLVDSAIDSVVFGGHQSCVHVESSSNVDGVVTVTFRRPLVAVGPTDVAISTTSHTIVNWAVGFTSFPDYHDAQGSASIAFGTPVLPPPAVCSQASFPSTVRAVNLGPIALKSTLLGPFACFHATLRGYPNATWFALSVAPTTNMINTPANNAIVFHAANGTAALYDLIDSAPDGVVYQPDQSPLKVLHSSVVNGDLVLLFQRPVAATVPTDVAISLTDPNLVNWAVGTSAWPDYHDIQGSALIQFDVATETQSVSPIKTTVVPTYTSWIAATTFTLIAFLGAIVTHSGSFRWAKHQRLTAPPATNLGWFSGLVKTLADVTWGEVVVVAIYVLALVGVAISVLVQFPTATSSRLVALVSGHVSLLSLTFILLPVARGAHWEWLFGASHERLIKLHRWLGRVFVLTATLHLVANLPLATYAKSFGSQQVVPVFGFVAYLSFASMALLALESIRRQTFEVFYYYHRIASIVGLVFVVLHSATIRATMGVPLALYAATYVWRFRGYLNKYHARIQSHVPGTVVFTLPVTPQTQAWARTMNPCSFFWVNIPSVSVLQWHPFSAVVTPDGHSIAFCIKALKAGSFADQVIAQAKTNLVSMTLIVGGPYGKPSVDFTKYDEVILISGGIGVTPFVSLVNQLPHTLPSAPFNTHIQFHWVVRTEAELLVADSLMFTAPLPTFVSPHYYVDGSAIDGSVVTTDGHTIAYTGTRPKLDKILSAESYVGKKVCVLVCGPPSLALSVQTHAYNAGFDFHKEVFEY
ncbi:hypothetical protein DYB25_005906 [Aphanomyces astaci]|uniref:DOMON domain-containing protein n=1 Tax=Aphanomyces astaci TaxID=112090 RepID=A0A397BZT5_APHAT|nr:hypothetical protein DYB25_005906 [Aphanomyces astaci]RHZ07430.1 hypothetical protein DYB31_000597 [Aphanomyces astaci]RHZ28089.1 hypothetical protein DYB26_001785 [Aphanomyces astaci]